MTFYESNSALKNHIMLIDTSHDNVTYGDFDLFYETNFAKLRSRTLMFILCTNTIGSVFFYMGCLRKKIVPLLLDAAIDRELLQTLMATYQPDYLCTPDSVCMPDSVCIPNSVCMPDCLGVPDSVALFSSQAQYTQLITAWDYTVLEITKSQTTRLHPDLALLLTTSGSTGSPKLVRISYKNLNANAASIAAYLHLNATERPVTTLPMSYTYGLSILNSHFLVGATVLLTTHTLLEKDFWLFVKMEHATSLSGVPYTYEMLKRLSVFDMPLPDLRTLTQAGGRLSPALHRYFASHATDTGRQFIVMYGQTEATARMSYLPSSVSQNKIGSIGLPIPGGRFYLIDAENEKITDADTEGELIYCGDNVTMGYSKCADDLSRGDDWHGTLHTGDIAMHDKDGYYYITGRKKRFLKLFGKRVNLNEVEEMIQKQFHFQDIACAGDDRKLRVYIVDHEPSMQDQASETVENWLSEKIGIHQSAIHVEMITEIPRNEAGKILYGRLQ